MNVVLLRRKDRDVASSFILRNHGFASTGDSGFDPNLGVDVELVSKIKLDDSECGNIGNGEFWIAKDPDDKFVIVNEFDLMALGYLGD